VTVLAGRPADATLSGDVLAHLDAQIASAQHLLELILQQGRAIRARDVDAVLNRLTAIQAELERRNQLEAARADLLNRAGRELGAPPTMVTLKQLTSIMPVAAGTEALTRSAQLQGLLTEVAREHGINRALMRQELTFLSHLTRLISGEPEGGYRPPSAPAPSAAASRPAQPHQLLDLQA
jgi:hypothetical protein